MQALEEYFEIKTRPTVEPYIILIDDIRSHFSPSQFVLGLLLKSQTNYDPMKLSKYARAHWKTHPEDFTMYKDTSGISEAAFTALTIFMRSHTSKILQLIIDWDETLTVHSSFRSDTIDKYVAECYLGGKSRMKKITQLFDECRRQNIHIAVLTCNKRANRLSGNLAFQEVLKYVNGHIINVYFTDRPKIAYLNIISNDPRRVKYSKTLSLRNQPLQWLR